VFLVFRACSSSIYAAVTQASHSSFDMLVSGFLIPKTVWRGLWLRWISHSVGQYAAGLRAVQPSIWVISASRLSNSLFRRAGESTSATETCFRYRSPLKSKMKRLELALFSPNIGRTPRLATPFGSRPACGPQAHHPAQRRRQKPAGAARRLTFRSGITRVHGRAFFAVQQ